MATSIPPHNLGEVVDAVKAYMKNNDISTRGLMRYLKGPDFPTGGIVTNKDELLNIYETGSGKIKLRGHVEIEQDKSGKLRLVITEIPYTMIGANIGKFLNEDIPAVGFSIGFERIFGILMNNGISIEQRADKIAVVYEDGQLKDAVKAADALRAQGKIASLYIKPKKLGKFLNKLEERGYDGFLNVGVSEEVSMFEK